jgi:outer membrane protein assembly factor BamB
MLPALALMLAVAAPAGDWPGFRGPTGQGTSPETALPTEWSRDANILWKTPLPGEGWSSPIVSGDRVYVTAATDGGADCHVLALDRDTGTVVWDVVAFRQAVRHKQINNSYATPTPVTDGERVYVVFNDGTVAALTRDGQLAWRNTDYPFYSHHGLGSSPTWHKNLLILAYDGSSDGPDNKIGWKIPWEGAFLVALDPVTGRERWKTKRGLSRIAHATPMTTSLGDRDVLVSPAGDVVQAFDPATGERLWTVKGGGEGLVPSPVFGEGLVFATTGFENPTLLAIRLTPDGDPTTRTIAWQTKKNVPMIPSPVYVRPWLFSVTDQGWATCYEAATGRVLWEERLPGKFSASPVAADGKVYFLGEDGTTTVVRAGPTFDVIASNPLGEMFKASIAVAGGRLYLRGKSHLYCIGSR